MKIGLIDVDGHNWPNLCLMKLSACHKAHGDDVEWWTPGGRYDRVYKSRVFTDTYSKDTITVDNAGKSLRAAPATAPAPTCPTRWNTPARTTPYIRSFLARPTAL